MPLVLAENEATESGITYEDRTGVSYQYPKMYQRIIRPGERFVYYRGRRKRGGGRAPQVYFGSGVIGETRADANAPGRFICDILDYYPFPTPVPFKKENEAYFETGAERRGYFQRGVRVISQDDFQCILSAVQDSTVSTTNADLVSKPPDEDLSRLSYASSETSRTVDEYAIRVAVEFLAHRYPTAKIKVQPHNNPGFDILVTTCEKQFYVEVKGTGRATPRFFATDGELRFSLSQAQFFRLLVVYAIDIDSGTHKTFWHEGAISTNTGFSLKPVQWICEFELKSDSHQE